MDDEIDGAGFVMECLALHVDPKRYGALNLHTCIITLKITCSTRKGSGNVCLTGQMMRLFPATC